MRRKHLPHLCCLMAGLVASFAAGAQSIDVQATQSSPTNGQSIQSGVPFSLGIAAKNNSSTDIKSTDTLAFVAYVDNGTKKDTLQCGTFTGPGLPIAKNSSFGPFSTNCTYNFTTSFSGKVCQSIYLIKAGTSDPNVSNNLSCATVNFVASSSSCNAPSSISIPTIGATSATFNWPAVSGASSYEVAVTGSTTPPASGSSTTSTSATVTGLVASTKYYIYVRTKCGSTFSPWQAQYSFTTKAATTDVNAVQLNDQISISPNPASNLIHISSPLEGKIMVSDASGKVVIAQKIAANTTDIDISNLANGLYYYNVYDTESRFLTHGKLTVNH